jgi:hypothetical protein
MGRRRHVGSAARSRRHPRHAAVKCEHYQTFDFVTCDQPAVWLAYIGGPHHQYLRLCERHAEGHEVRYRLVDEP